MIKPSIHLALAGFLTMGLLAGCATTPTTSYYSLYAPTQAPAPVTTPAPATLVLSVGPVTIPDILKQSQIATGGADGRYRLSEYHRWSGELDRDFARTAAEQLSAELGTQQVAIFPWDENLTPTCRIQIDVLSMAGEPGKEATLGVRWVLVDPQGKLPVLVRRSDLREVPAGDGYAAWVAAQRRNIARLGQEIAGEVKLFTKP
jgi:uncharacterized lipoprotein YmbA